MSKYVFPAIFTKEDDGLFSINFPDFQACFTQGSDLADGLKMAKDVLELTLCDMEDEHEKIPKPSDPICMEIEKNSFISLISADTMEYRKNYSGKAVKKTLTIPEWLNTAAERQNINFSAVLQQALIERLNLK